MVLYFQWALRLHRADHYQIPTSRRYLLSLERPSVSEPLLFKSLSHLRLLQAETLPYPSALRIRLYIVLLDSQHSYISGEVKACKSLRKSTLYSLLFEAQFMSR